VSSDGPPLSFTKGCGGPIIPTRILTGKVTDEQKDEESEKENEGQNK
jgi:hypothetical protein